MAFLVFALTSPQRCISVDAAAQVMAARSRGAVQPMIFKDILVDEHNVTCTMV